MDWLMGVGNFVAEVRDTKEGIRKNLMKLDALHTKATKMFETAQWDDVNDQKQIKLYQHVLTEAGKLHQELEAKLSKLGLTDSLAMNLPFDKTKDNLKDTILELEKMIEDLKYRQQIPAVKRKLTSQYCKLQRTGSEVIIPELEVMGPTIEDKLDDRKGTWIRISMRFNSDQKILAILKEDVSVHQLDFEVSIQFESHQIQKEVLSFNRLKFKPYYDKIKKLIPEIDFISSRDKHFSILCVREKKQKISDNMNENDIKEILQNIAHTSSQKDKQKQSLGNKYGNSQEGLGEYFFSFPVQEQKQIQNYKVLCANHNKNGTYLLRRKENVWQKFEKTVELSIGDRISVLMKKPDRKQPHFTYQMNIQVMNFDS